MHDRLFEHQHEFEQRRAAGHAEAVGAEDAARFSTRELLGGRVCAARSRRTSRAEH